MRIAMIGTGYVGLVAGTCFAETGNTVVCVDNDERKIRKLRAGEIPIYEPGLQELVLRNVKEDRLSFTTDLAAAVKSSVVCFIAVGTPPNEDGSSDLTHVMAVAEEIARAMDGYRVIVDKSTVPVGTGRKVREAIAALTTHPFHVVSNPEFLKEGAAIEDFLRPDRVVIGTSEPRAAEIMKELYAPFVRTGNPILIMDLESAELTKYAANAMLASRISFMNEMALLCEKVGADVDSIRKGIGLDRRIGPSFLFPGAGYGGSCFPKDIKALLRTAAELDMDLRILRAVEEVNEAQKALMAAKIFKHFGPDLRGRTIAVWGLSFKPRTDDIREAPSLTVISRLLEAGARIRASDPVAIETAKSVFGDRILYFQKNYEALDGADALVLLTEWNEFRYPEYSRIRELLRQPVIFDGRNIMNRAKLEELGFTYYGIGV
ncbi:MAG: UDP-glucose/GDP-mannose dehydrogenase family protein [Planctomycetes bacterium]|nr:UDP-glucose/GDP-mannose dehydrogenase family protein [Planctomycetota bacterium]